MATITAGVLHQPHLSLVAPTEVRARDRALSQKKVFSFKALESVDSRGNRTTKEKSFRSGACAASTTTTEQSVMFLRVPSAQPTTLYDVLGISNMVTDDEIKAAFRRIAKAVHPDQAPPDQVGEYQRKFMEAHKAYSVLKDPRTRSLYNFEMSHTLRRTPTQFRSEDWRRPTWRGYNWETDQCWTS